MTSPLAALPCALCVLALPSPSVNPTARSEGFVSAPAGLDDDDAGSCCRCWLLRLGAGFNDRSNSHSDRTCTRSFVSRCLFPIALDILLCCVRSQADTATAARRCSTPRHGLGRRVHTSTSRWALVLLRHNRCFQVLRPAVPRKSSDFLQLTDHESLLKWHAMQRSRISGLHSH